MQLQALSSGSHYFDYILINRPKPYDKVKAWVIIENDNDPSNDTTTTFIEPTFDLDVVKVFVEENAAPECNVYLQVQNLGNTAFASTQIKMHAIINDSTIYTAITPDYLYPGHTVTLPFAEKIPKRKDRKYEGRAWVEMIASDTNRANDTTSVVQLVNYMDGIDEVDEALFELGQNYPNPFTQHTVVPFSLPNGARVRIFVLDAMGHTVYRTEGFYAAGDHKLDLDLGMFPSGVYFYGIEVGTQRQLRKMIMK